MKLRSVRGKTHYWVEKAVLSNATADGSWKMTQMSRGFEEVTLSVHKSLVSATMLPTVKGPELISDPTSNRIVSAADRSKKKKTMAWITGVFFSNSKSWNFSGS